MQPGVRMAVPGDEGGIKCSVCQHGRHWDMQRAAVPAQRRMQRARLTGLCLSPRADQHAATPAAHKQQDQNELQYLQGIAGKSFHCTGCGKCCTMAADSEVWVCVSEAQAIAARLGISTGTFYAQYCQAYPGVPGWRMLQSKPGAVSIDADGVSQVIGEVCTFLDGATNNCTIHGDQPTQCSTYPWWPHLQPANEWQAEKTAVCEGLNHADAPVTDARAAVEQLLRAEEHEQRLEAAKPVDWNPCLELYPNRPELW